MYFFIFSDHRGSRVKKEETTVRPAAAAVSIKYFFVYICWRILQLYKAVFWVSSYMGFNSKCIIPNLTEIKNSRLASTSK